MIEVERKFAPTDEQLQKISDAATFIQEKIFTDIYYDTPSYSLTENDTWLRQRQGAWELKVASEKNVGATDIYHEIVEIEKISQFLQEKLGNSLDKLIAKGTIEPFAELVTRRKKFTFGSFNIDVDTVSAENLSYSLAEIEMLVKDESEKAAAAEAIDQLAHDFGLSCDAIIPGKVLAYMEINRQNHFNHLMEKGVIRSTANNLPCCSKG